MVIVVVVYAAVIMLRAALIGRREHDAEAATVPLAT
jgi:hypothetical protein